MRRDLTESYERDGYVVMRELLPRADVLQLRERAEAFVTAAAQPESREAGLAQTAYDRAKRSRLTKVSNMVGADAAFDALASRVEIVDVVEALLGEGARRFRDVLVVKPARSGGPFSYHQDSAYWDVEPRALVSCWIGLGDVPEERSCLTVVPGSHRTLVQHGLYLGGKYAVPSPVTRGLRALVSLAGTGDNPGKGASAALFTRLKRAVLMGATRHVPALFDLQDFRLPPEAIHTEREVKLPVRAGDVVFFHSLLFHASGPNRTEETRYAEILSFMSRDARYTGRGAPAFERARRT